MGLAPHHPVVKTLTSDRADCALDISVLPWRSRRDRAVANAHRPNPPREYLAISAVIVADEKGRGCVPWKGFGDLVANDCAVGFVATPIQKMFLRPTPSMTNANRRSKVSVKRLKSLPLQFHRRDCADNVFQPCEGGFRLRSIYFETVDCAAVKPSLSSSPWIRAAPHSRFSPHCAHEIA